MIFRCVYETQSWRGHSANKRVSQCWFLCKWLFRLAAAAGSEPKYQVHEQESSGDEDSDLSPEEQGSLLPFMLLALC